MKTVKCINDCGQTQIKEGKIYNVDIIAECKCGNIVYGIKRIDNYARWADPKLKTLCTCGRKLDYNNKPVFSAKRFIDLTSHSI